MLCLMPMCLAVYVHTLDPFVFQIGGIGVRWYGLSYLVGFFIAYQLIRRVVSTGSSTVQPQRVGDLVVAIAFGVVAGGRLGYVLFYRPEMLWTFTPNLPFWDLLAINKGGMASHGGMIGAILSSYYYHKRHTRSAKYGWAHILDLIAFAAPLGLFFGRIANFINGELYGRPCAATLPWAVKFPQEMYTWSGQKLAHLNRITAHLSPPDSEQWSNTGYRVPQIIEQIQNKNRELMTLVEPLLTPRHPSQIYQALLEGLLLFVILGIVWLKSRKPGVIAGLFCLVYSVLRIIGEQFRQPDAHLGFQWLGLTRGQWLSVALLLLGTVVVAVCSKRTAEPLGGLLQKSPPKPST